MRAAWDLRNSKDTRVVDSLLHALSDTDVVVRAVAVDSLGAVKDPRAIESIISALKDSDASVRAVAANALGEMKDTRAVPPLILALKDEEMVRLLAARALDSIGDDRSIEPLISAIRNKDLAIVAGGYRFFIRRGEVGTEPILVEALKTYGGTKGNDRMYLAYYLSGNTQLEEGAKAFAEAHGGHINEGMKQLAVALGAPKWGSGRK
jgi:HEAT repeat protein